MSDKLEDKQGGLDGISESTTASGNQVVKSCVFVPEGDAPFNCMVCRNCGGQASQHRWFKNRHVVPLEIRNRDIRALFEMVYKWGRVGIVVDENAPAFRDSLKDVVLRVTSHISMTPDERHELFDRLMQVTDLRLDDSQSQVEDTNTSQKEAELKLKGERNE